MINKETILSNYNDRLTLLQWLKKVELALKNASAKEFRVNQLGNATLTFSIVFDDDTELTTGPIVLQQGESVASASITNGHLLLTLTNGDVLDAGNTGAVTGFSIDASQHLIITYQDGTTQDLGAIFQGNVNITGNMNVTGNLTGDSIIENMTGYTYFKYPKANFNVTSIYAGIVKNGNKLTFVDFFKVERTGSVDGNFVSVGHFGIPNDVGQNLYPYTIAGETNTLDYRKLDAYKVSNASSVSINCYVQKNTNTDIVSVLVGVNSLDVNEEYVIRIERTFLLSENLAL